MLSSACVYRHGRVDSPCIAGGAKAVLFLEELLKS